MDVYWERIIGVAVVMPAIYGFIYWWFPDLTLSGKVALGAPMLLIFALAVVWPERKGLPYSKQNAEVRLIWKFLVGLAASNLFLVSVIVYTFLFPNSSFFHPIPLPYLPENLSIWFFGVEEVVFLLAFLISVRGYVARLPPKETKAIA